MQSLYNIWFEWAEQLVKGIKKAYWIDISEDFTLFEYDAQNVNALLISDQLVIERTKQFCRKLRNKEWLLEEDLPFNEIKRITEIKQLSLNQESERNLLSLKLEGRHQSIVLILFIKDATSVIGPTLSQGSLNVQQKKIIEELLLRSLDSYIKLHDANIELQQRLSSFQIHLRESNIKYRELAKFSALSQSQNIEAYIKSLLKEIGNSNDLILDINKESINYLISENISPEALRKNLTKMIEVLKFSAEDKRLMIDQVDLEWAFQTTFEDPLTVTKSAPIENIGRLTKTKILLDRYEEAARQAVYNDENVNGKNIAKYCVPSVSNASITDALKKHSDRIVELMLKNGNEWPLLRSKFKSISNIMELHNEQRHTA
jgi:hypothetical protein